MRLSEAIRLGSLLKPQNFYGLLKHGRTCALGAALDAIGVNLECCRWSLDRFEGARQIGRVTCPVGGCGHVEFLGPYSVDVIIVHLNDTHLWPRERIADWVEQQEVIAGLQRADAGVAEITAAGPPASGEPDSPIREAELSLV